MKKAIRNRKNKNNHFKAIMLTLLIHAGIIGGILFANGDFDGMFQSDTETVENPEDQILSKAITNTTSKYKQTNKKSN